MNLNDTASLKKAIVSLAVLVPIPSIGVLSAMVLFPDTALGKALFAVSKAGLLGLPLAWYLWVDKGTLSLSLPRRGGFGVAVLSGLIISAAILAAYWLLGDYFLDKNMLREKLRDIGLADRTAYAAGAVYWIVVNSVLEEYVWRWFVVRQSGRLFKPFIAVIVSALFFTGHHTIALKVFMPWTATLLCSFGVFSGGAIWSWLYVRYQSIWPGYISHAIVDLCIFGIGAAMLFG
ncbi:MAG: CPBP family intramembrane metalloprotease [Phycisphaerae bacterium]|nr:CPBP family intramembrane metalloprotease [Phycisphaerae bacterium]